MRDPDNSQQAVDSGNDFAKAMYGQLKRRQGNLFFISDESMHAGLGQSLQRLDGAGGKECVISVANSLWVQEGMALQDQFAEVVRRHYGASLNAVDFRKAPKAACGAINAWVEDRTRRHIREDISEDGMGVDLRLVLVNAIHFKASWEQRFSKGDTTHEPFQLEGGGKPKVPLMHQWGDFP